MQLDDKILNLWDRLGYYDDRLNGACHGYTIRWLEACLLEQLHQFEERKKLILELDIELVIIAIQHIKEKTIANVSLLLEDQRLINLLFFLESMFAFQSRLIQQEILGFSRLREIHKISAIASTEEIYQKGGLVTCQLEVGNYSKNELEAWLQRYEAVINAMETPQTVFVFSLSNEVHTIGIMYQKNIGSWIVEDVQNSKESPLPSLSKQEISEQIYMGLRIREVHRQAYLSRNQFFRKALQEIEANLVNKKSKSWQFTWSNDSFKTTVIYDVKTGKWSPQDKNQILELDVMADYLTFRFMGVTEPCPYINMATTMYLTQYDENLYDVTQKFRQKLLPYEPCADWLQRANAFYLVLLAAQEGNIDLIKKIIEMHLYNEDAPLYEALFYAVQENDIEIVKDLMTLPSAIRLINQISPEDSTPLIIAIQNGHVEIVELLLNLGVNPNISNSFGDSLLIIAAHGGHLKIVNRLIDAHAMLDHRNLNGATALSLAVEGHHIAVVERLIQAGADTSIPNHRGITPLQKAVALNDSVLVTLLSIEISANCKKLTKSWISDNVTSRFFGLKNQSGDPMELGLRRHFCGYQLT
jgi:hypothetical protein